MEPIKVTISERVARILEKDADLFNILGSKDKPNKNKLYNRIIQNYQHFFTEQHKETTEDLAALLKEINLDNDDKKKLIYKVSKYIERKKMVREKADKSTHIRVQINQGTLSAYEDFMEEYKNDDDSISECLNRLFCSYVSTPLNIREQIIFKETADRIKKAIEMKKQIRVTQREIKKTVHPYALVTSKEELYNYLLCKEVFADGRSQIVSFRLTHLSNVFIIRNADTSFTDFELACLEATKIHNNPQYIMKNPNPRVKVLLSNEGDKKLKRIYTHRPELEKKEGHIYTFICSPEQANVYFSKFKKEAVVIEPKELTKQMQKDFYETQKTYHIYLNEGLESCMDYMERKKVRNPSSKRPN